MSDHERNVEVLLSSIETQLREANARLVTIEANAAKTEKAVSKWKRREVIVAIMLGVVFAAIVIGIGMALMGGRG